MSQYINGIDLFELAAAKPVGDITAGDWVRLPKIEDGSVSYAVTAPTRTRIRVEDEPGVKLTILGDQDPDVMNFGTIDLAAQNILKLFGGRIDAATNIFYAPGDTLIVPMAIRLTTKLVNGVKTRWTFQSTEMTASFNGNFTRGGIVTVRVAADILTFDDGEGNQVKCFVETLNAAGDLVKVNTDGTITPVSS